MVSRPARSLASCLLPDGLAAPARFCRGRAWPPGRAADPGPGRGRLVVIGDPVRLAPRHPAPGSPPRAARARVRGRNATRPPFPASWASRGSGRLAGRLRPTGITLGGVGVGCGPECGLGVVPAARRLQRGAQRLRRGRIGRLVPGHRVALDRAGLGLGGHVNAPVAGSAGLPLASSTGRAPRPRCHRRHRWASDVVPVEQRGQLLGLAERRCRTPRAAGPRALRASSPRSSTPVAAALSPARAWCATGPRPAPAPLLPAAHARPNPDHALRSPPSSRYGTPRQSAGPRACAHRRRMAHRAACGTWCADAYPPPPFPLSGGLATSMAEHPLVQASLRKVHYRLHSVT